MVPIIIDFSEKRKGNKSDSLDIQKRRELQLTGDYVNYRVERSKKGGRR